MFPHVSVVFGFQRRTRLCRTGHEWFVAVVDFYGIRSVEFAVGSMRRDREVDFAPYVARVALVGRRRRKKRRKREGVMGVYDIVSY